MAEKKRKRRESVTAKRVQATENKPFSPPDVENHPEVDEDPLDAEGLTPRQLLFVEALVGPAGANASKAAAMAGYRADNTQSLYSTASRTLSFVKVKEAIARRCARANLTPEWIKEMTAALAASNMGTFLTLRDDGEPEINWREAQRVGAFVQIRKFKEKGLKIPGATGEAAKVDIIERTIETHNPAPFLNLLARMLGLVTDPPGGAIVNVNVNQISENDLVRIATRGRDGTVEAQAGTGESDRIR